MIVTHCLAPAISMGKKPVVSYSQEPEILCSVEITHNERGASGSLISIR